MTGRTQSETAMNEAKRSNDQPTMIVEGCWPAAIAEENYMSNRTQIVHS